MKKKSLMPHENSLTTNRHTRGGQIYFHEWRMRFQNIKTVLKVSILFLVLSFIVGLFCLKITKWQLIDFYCLTYVPTQLKVYVWPCLRAWIEEGDFILKSFFPGSHGLLSNPKKLYHLTTTFQLPEQKQVTLYAIDFLNHPWVKAQLIPLKKLCLITVSGWVLGIIYLINRFKQKSNQIDTDKHLRGKRMKSTSVVKSLIMKKGKPRFYISPEIPLPKDTENQHIAVFGATRMGKTNCILGLLQQIRKRGERAIVLDVTGELTSKFYRLYRDKLFNPFDKRTESWSIWSEQLPAHEYDAWAATIIPEGKGDPIWHGNARKLLAYTAYKLSKQSKKVSMIDILRWCCWNPLDSTTEDFYKNSSVASFMNKESEKTAAGVRMQLSQSITAFEFLNNESHPFSLTHWIENNKHTDEWVFLTALPSQRNTLAPLLASQFSLAFLGLERAGIDFKNRLWMICDELPGLDIPLSGLKRMMAEGGKYGACCILGFQNKSQMDVLYGQANTKTILSNCSTKVIFRSPDYETAKNLSQNSGEQEILTISESYSVGAHQMRDGVNLSSQHRHKSVVSPDEIMTLNPLEAYVLLPGDYPTCKTTFKLVKQPIVQPPFIPI